MSQIDAPLLSHQRYGEETDRRCGWAPGASSGRFWKKRWPTLSEGHLLAKEQHGPGEG